jgi:hypothetical protein
MPWYFFPCYLWTLPHTIVGLLLAILYRPTSWRWRDGCLEAISTHILGRPGAQTHGAVIFFASEAHRDRADLRVHERVHVLQGFLGGPIYVLAYVFHFAWLFAFAPKEPAEEPRWKRAYRRIYFERIAYRIQAEYQAGKRPNAWGAK